MAKLDIDFILLDESVVMYGFRALMSGAQLEGFMKNPVMLFMHERAASGVFESLTDDVVLPIGKWYDIRIEGDKLLAKPEFDDDDDFAKRIEGKVKKGYLNAASICLEPIAVTDETNLMLPGQVGPTITKWSLMESSIVDIPNCRNALAIRNSASKRIALKSDAQKEEVNILLNSLIPKNLDNMDKKLLAAKLGLSENATDAEISTRLAAILGDAGKVVGVEAEVVKLKGDKVSLEAKLAALETAAAAAKNEGLIDAAIAAKKLTAGERDKWVKLAAADFETTKELIDSMKGFEGVEGRLSTGVTGTDNTALQELLKLSGRDLYIQDKFEKLKALSPEHYKIKYKEYTGVEPK